MIAFGNVPAGSVLPIFFNTFAAAGGSVTITGLAVTDIEIYKGTSMTQRSSDAGYALLDTDGIDLDGTTGIHGFSIDTGDNTDAGFFAAGSFYNVVISAITADSQTVNFLAATFRLVVADPLTATVPGRTLDVTATGAAGIDWGNIENPTTAVNFTSTIFYQVVDVDNTISATVTTGGITTASFAAGAIDAAALAADAGTEIATAVWASATRTLTAGTNIVLAKGTGVTGFTDIDAAGVRTAVGLASANLDTQLDALPTAAENTTAVWAAGTRTITGGTIGTITGLTIADVESMAARFLGMIELDVSVYRYTTNALEQAPAGGGGGGATAAQILAYDGSGVAVPDKCLLSLQRLMLNRKVQRMDGSTPYLDIYMEDNTTVAYSIELVTGSPATPVVGTGSSA